MPAPRKKGGGDSVLRLGTSERLEHPKAVSSSLSDCNQGNKSKGGLFIMSPAEAHCVGELPI